MHKKTIHVIDSPVQTADMISASTGTSDTIWPALVAGICVSAFDHHQ